MIYEFGQKTDTGFIRNKFGSFEEVKSWAKDAGNKDVYSSIYGYDSPAIETCDLFAGLYFDLDNEDLNKAHADLLALLELFKQQGIDPQEINVCFSGNKGFHLYISPLTLGIMPGTDLPRVYRKIAEEIALYLPNRSLDLKVYERRRLWRLLNSVHGKSNLYKIQLPVTIPSLADILELAKQPQEVRKPLSKFSPVLSGWITRARKELDQPKMIKKITISDKSISPSNDYLIQNGVSSGDRNQTCFYLACYLNSKGFSTAEIQDRLLFFANNCTPPLSERDVERTIQSALKARPI